MRTKTLVKNAIVVIDATPFRQWYESHYALPIGRSKGAKLVSFLLYVLPGRFLVKDDKISCLIVCGGSYL